jgi:nitrogen-specific signal transduction histidine kinase
VGAAQMAHKLAHEINNPLQSMTNIAYLVEQGGTQPDAKMLGRELSKDIDRLSGLVREILSLPFEAGGPDPRGANHR